jgi:hypothetical protein
MITSTHLEDWTKWIVLASAVYNNRTNATTGLSSNQIILEYEPSLEPLNADDATANATIEARQKEIERFQNMAIEALNKKAETAPTSQFTTGDQLWLEASHLCLPHQKTKLAPK